MKNIDHHKAKVIAFYLPQFHPIAENDNWWGKGFTEWTNVAKAKPLFHNHYQPKVPADLGFYDLRVPEIRQQQAQLAREAGVDAFCYWHYWLGGGKQLMEYPLQEVVKSKNPDFPFCLGWANHTWYKKAWNSSVSRFSQEKLIEQTYPIEDIDKHFHTMLPMFQDDRYYRLHNKLVFLIYDPLSIPYLKEFMERWQDLASQYNLPGFYFIAQVDANTIKKDYSMFDAVNYDCIRNLFNNSRLRRFIAYTIKRPIIRQYKSILKIYDLDIIKSAKVYPTIYPNWDVTPRIGYIGTILQNSTPALFKKHVEQIIQTISHKAEEDQVIFLKSWNEWGEGNYMEPDLKFGKGFICALRDALSSSIK